MSFLSKIIKDKVYNLDSDRQSKILINSRLNPKCDDAFAYVALCFQFQEFFVTEKDVYFISKLSSELKFTSVTIIGKNQNVSRCMIEI